MNTIKSIRTGTVNINEGPGCRISGSKRVTEAAKVTTNALTFLLPW